MTSPGSPSVFLVDDHALIRSGIRAEIAESVRIVGEADEVDSAIELICERRPDVVLLDVHMPHGAASRCSRP
jgi:DNA-binding NarL/FixJ family response regulator